MRRLVLGDPLPIPGGFEKWIENALREIERASVEDMEAIISEFSTTGAFTETRTFNAATATLGDLRNVLATLISDIKKRGQKRSYGT